MIKEVLHRALLRIFREEIDEGFFLFVKEEGGNLLTGSSFPSGAGNIHVKGRLDSLERFSQMDPVSIKGLSIISEHVTYWLRIIDDYCFEIRSSSNLLGRSGLTLLKIKRKGIDDWIVDSGSPNAFLSQQVIFEGDYQMGHGVFDILAGIDNPYKRDQESVFALDPSVDIIIDVENAVLYVDGHVWFHFEDF